MDETPRTYLSKRLRNLLWVAADGKCQICGAPLDERWHADHIISWRDRAETNIHNMQALCVDCNLRKGPMSFRRHQYEMIELMKEVEAGATPLPKIIAAHVAPGGGKQGLAGIASHYLIERSRKVEKVCWVVPNGSLRNQAAKSLLKTEWLAKSLGHRLEIYESVNDPNPTKGKSGYTITYHALVADRLAGVNSRAFDAHRYLLVLDEWHHLAVDSPFHSAVWPLVRKAECVLLMSGTLDRGDQQRVYLMPYGDDLKADTTSTADFRWIRYTIEQAMRERAIIRVHFKHLDARWKYRQDAQEYQGDTLGEDRNAIFTALRTEYAQMLLAECLEHWLAYKRSHSRSKLLVVCADVRTAQVALKQIQRMGVTRCGIATYKDEDADEIIKHFKRSDETTGSVIDVLVTVAKAYEGLDVQQITHLAALTHIRSRPWIEQMIARAWRRDYEAGPWESQIAYCWAPDDKLFQQCIDAIVAEQELAVREDREEDPGGLGPKSGGDLVKPAISPIASGVTDVRASEFGGDGLGANETRLCELAAREAGLAVSPIELMRAIEAFNRLKAAKAYEPVAIPVDWGVLTPTELLRSLRQELDAKVGQAAWEASHHRQELVKDWKITINKELKRQFGERDTLDEDVFKAAIRWVGERYGV